MIRMRPNAGTCANTALIVFTIRHIFSGVGMLMRGRVRWF